MDVINYILSKKLKKYVDDSVGNVPDEKITEAVNTYLEENPVAPGATSEQAEQIQDNTNKIDELKSDLTLLSEDVYNTINTAWENGGLSSSGTQLEQEGFMRTSFIPVREKDLIRTNSEWFRINLYGESKSQSIGQADYNKYTDIYVVPKDIHFVRFVIKGNTPIDLYTKKAKSVYDVLDFNCDPSLENCTETFQDALNYGGEIIVTKPGRYKITGLTIYDRTKLKISKGVEIYLIDNSKNYMIKNSQCFSNPEDVITKDHIQIIGGVWNGNYEKNQKDNAAFAEGVFEGWGIFLNNVSDLNLENIYVKACEKYAIMIANAENLHINNIGFNNPSDGLHFQPPITNCYISDIYGATGDDMIAFTLGDFPNYVVSKKGSFVNVVVDGINATSALEFIKITGSGDNSGNYKFKNMTFNNINGTCTLKAISINDDRSHIDGGLYEGTIVEGIIFNNLNIKDKFCYIDIKKGDITFNNVSSTGQNNFIRLMNSAGYNVDDGDGVDIIINNFSTHDYKMAEGLVQLRRASDTYAPILNSLIITSSRCDFDGGHVVYCNGGNAIVKNVNIVGCIFRNYQTDKTSICMMLLLDNADAIAVIGNNIFENFGRMLQITGILEAYISGNKYNESDLRTIWSRSGSTLTVYWAGADIPTYLADGVLNLYTNQVNKI